MKRTYGRLVLVPCSLVALVAACRGAGTTGAAPTTDDTASTDDTGASTSDASSSTKKKDAASDPCADGKSRAASQSCCEDLGVDACGANLFCAAFDGRSQGTCYPENSRKDMSECGADIHCVSAECNATEKKCKSLAGADCTEAIGCAPDTDKVPYLCLSGTCTRDPAYCPNNTLKTGKDACDAAVSKSCCSIAGTCSADAACVASLKCALACPSGDTTCRIKCVNSNGKIQSLYSCASKLPECSF